MELIKNSTKEEIKAMEKAEQERLRKEEERRSKETPFKIPAKRPKPFKLFK